LVLVFEGRQAIYIFRLFELICLLLRSSSWEKCHNQQLFTAYLPTII